MTNSRKKRAFSVFSPRAVLLVPWLVLCFSPWVAFSQGRLFDDDNFDGFFDKEGQKFDDRLEKEWEAFEQFLEKQWKQFEIQAGIRPYRESKPRDPPALRQAADARIQLNPVDPGAPGAPGRDSSRASSQDGDGESCPPVSPGDKPPRGF